MKIIVQSSDSSSCFNYFFASVVPIRQGNNNGKGHNKNNMRRISANIPYVIYFGLCKVLIMFDRCPVLRTNVETNIKLITQSSRVCTFWICVMITFAQRDIIR